jgi:hypothetical protein
VHDVFLSYAREDHESAKILAEGLENSGLSVWWDRRIIAGQNFHRVIEGALDDSKCVVVLWSLNSVESDWVLNEASHGAERKSLIPVKLSDVRIPIAFRSHHTEDWKTGSEPPIDSIVNGIRHAMDIGHSLKTGIRIGGGAMHGTQNQMVKTSLDWPPKILVAIARSRLTGLHFSVCMTLGIVATYFIAPATYDWMDILIMGVKLGFWGGVTIGASGLAVVSLWNYWTNRNKRS